MASFFINKWNFKLNKLKEDKFTLNPKIDSFEILKDENNPDKYIITAEKNTPIFDLDISYEFDFKDDSKNDTEEKKKEYIQNIFRIEASSLLSVFLKYNDLPPFPLLLDFDREKDE